MNLYLMYFLILSITIVFFIIIKDKIKAIRITGIISVSSSFLIITIALTIKIILNISITSINASPITNYLFLKFANTSLILFLIGLTEILISKHIYNRKKYNTQKDSS